MINILHLAPNIHTSKFGSMSIDEKECATIQQNELFKLVSNTNIIKNVISNDGFTLEKAKLFVALCPRMENLRTFIVRKDFESIVRILLSKSGSSSRQLFFLCIQHVPKLCIRQLKRSIKSEKLLDDYLIDYINRDLYLWC
jgi:hypothetical protein